MDDNNIYLHNDHVDWTGLVHGNYPTRQHYLLATLKPAPTQIRDIYFNEPRIPLNRMYDNTFTLSLYSISSPSAAPQPAWYDKLVHRGSDYHTSHRAITQLMKVKFTGRSKDKVKMRGGVLWHPPNENTFSSHSGSTGEFLLGNISESTGEYEGGSHLPNRYIRHYWGHF